MTALLRDVLEIPERTGAEDYVLRLTDSVGGGAVARTLDEYVVTPAIADAFDKALGLVAEAISSNISRGAFLVGSFGSGKSHFMAVLHALLRHEPAARAKAELHPVIARHDGALLDRKVLPLAFHVLGADSLEQALFDGYLRQLAELHPDAPVPALHKSDELFADAEKMRGQIGDAAFFAGLNGNVATPAADGWSAFVDSTTWTVERYDAARAASPGSAARQELVTALVRSFFGSYTRQAAYLDLDTGLAAITTHAKSLGYDAVVLFLDEVVLWLAFAVRDIEFFRRESQKLTKLVESSTGVRAVPLISFVARQLDLRRWFADAGASGAEQESLDQVFRHQEGRFSTIELGDDNLPFVAAKRLLRRRPGADADRVLADAFDALDRRSDVWDVLLDGVNTDEAHRGSDEAAFRLTYPFSPALVSTLRSLAGAMQRERTALKVMQQMLVDRRDTLTVDDVVPVGDSFDYIVNGHQALDPQLAALFRSATTLYVEKLRPILLTTHGLTLEDVERAGRDPGALPRAYRAHDRLIKTLLLSAVAPKVPALRELTASRLASLNHGSIAARLPGAEVSTVLGKVREWARQVPEIHVEEGPRNPVIRVRLSDVDYESIVERARGEDNDGRRRELLKNLVREAFGVTSDRTDQLGAYTHSIVWRGSARDVDLVFGNVRDAAWLGEDQFRARPDTWRLVVDHPFDDAGHSASEDLGRLDRMLEAGFASHTVVWLPRFLSEERMVDVRRLVILDWLLTGAGERWTTYADHLSEVDRVQAKAILEQQRSGLREGLRRAVQQSYGAATPSPGNLVHDAAHDRILVSLHPGFRPAPPVGADLGAAFGNLLDQAWESRYPGHPRFEPGDVEVTTKQLVAVYEHVERAVADPDGRVRLEGDTRFVRRVSSALGVGLASETHYLFGDDRFTPWGAEFERATTRDGVRPDDAVTVERVRKWIAGVQPPRGLRPEVSDLVVLAWAALRQRAWHHHGAPLPHAPKPGTLRPEMELRAQRLPERPAWDAAVARMRSLLGENVNPHLTAQSVTRLVDKARDAAQRHYDAAAALVTELDAAYRRLGMPTDQELSRLGTARGAAALLDAIRKASDRIRVVTLLAELASPTSDHAVSRSVTTASTVAAALRGHRWERLGPLREAAREQDERGLKAARIIGALQDAARRNQIDTDLVHALRNGEDATFDWLAEAQPTRPTQWSPTAGAEASVPSATRPLTDTAALGTSSSTTPGGTVIARGGAARTKGTAADPVLEQLAAFLDEHADTDVVVEWRVRE